MSQGLGEVENELSNGKIFDKGFGRGLSEVFGEGEGRDYMFRNGEDFGKGFGIGFNKVFGKVFGEGEGEGINKRFDHGEGESEREGEGFKRFGHNEERREGKMKSNYIKSPKNILNFLF